MFITYLFLEHTMIHKTRYKNEYDLFKVRDYLNDADTKTIFGFNPDYDFSMSSGDVY